MRDWIVFPVMLSIFGVVIVNICFWMMLFNSPWALVPIIITHIAMSIAVQVFTQGYGIVGVLDRRARFKQVQKRRAEHRRWLRLQPKMWPWRL